MLRNHLNLEYAEHPKLVDNLPVGKIYVEETVDSKEVWFKCGYFVGKKFRMTPTFSKDFTDAEIFASQDVEDWLKSRFGFRSEIRWTL